MIDWTNGECQVTSHFTVKDCLYLHQWQRLAHIDHDGVYLHKLVALCQKLEEVRECLGGSPMNIHSMFRSQEYNHAIGLHLLNDVHARSVACDFDCSPTLTIPQVKELLRPQLKRLGMRMEKGTTTWVHLDTYPVGVSGREFTA